MCFKQGERSQQGAVLLLLGGVCCLAGHCQCAILKLLLLLEGCPSPPRPRLLLHGVAAAAGLYCALAAAI